MKIFKKKKEENKTPWIKVYEDKNIKKEVDYSGSMYDKILESRKNYPYNIAYTYFKTSSTYKKFIKDVNKCAKALKNIGVKEKDVVTICMPNTPEAIITFYAINKIGAIANMVHPLSSENEIKKYVNESSSKVMLAINLIMPKLKNIINETCLEKIIVAQVNDRMDTLTSIGYYLISGRKYKKIKDDDRIIYFKKFFHDSKKYKKEIDIVVDPKAPAVILHSGGTTGKPKGIVLSSESFNYIAASELEVCKDLSEGISVLSAMPIFHGFGLGSTIHAPLYVGGTCKLLPQLNPKKFGKTIKKYKPNIIACVPSLYEALISSKALKNEDLSFIICAICGGDNLTKNLKEKVDKFFKEHESTAEVRSSYGMTECTSGVTMMPKKSGKLEGIGVPCPHSFVKIVSPNTNIELSYGEIGEICVSGPSVMIEYLNEPEETSKILRKHDDGKLWLHTGDLGYMDKEGYVYFKQRLKRMIISNGYNIYPSQIEEVISSHPDVLSCTVIGVNHSKKGQVPKAFIVLKEKVESNYKLKQSIIKLCEENISAYALPTKYEFRDALPKTLVGKVAYRELEEEEEKNEEE